MPRFDALGRSLFAVGAILSGLRQLYTGAFERLVPAVPAWMPWPDGTARLTGVVLVAAGAVLLSGYRIRPGSLVLAVLLCFVLVAIQLPAALGNPWAGFMWTNPCKVLALSGGALVIAGWRNAAGWLFLALFLALCGVQHFVYAGFVDTLVPAWIPPGRRFWTITAGLALLAGGVGLLWRRTARLATLLSALMIFLWVFLVHLPRAVAGRSSVEFDGACEALAMSGVALLAGTVRRAGPAEAAGPR